MRADGCWSEVCVLNIGERGVGLQASASPVRGTYVEICRGAHVLIGCVAWSNGRRFGVRTQDQIAIEEIIAEPHLSTAKGDGAPRGRPAFERRAAPRPMAERGERSRHAGRALEFTFVAILGVSAAFVAFETVHQAFAKPMSTVTATLKPR